MFVKKTDIPTVFISPKIEARKSSIHGWGVFAKEKIEKHEIIESALAVCFHSDTYQLLREITGARHILCDYGYVVPDTPFSCMLMGYGMLYNHSDDPNIGYNFYGSPEPDSKEPVYARFRTRREIQPDEELVHKYAHNIYFTDAGGWNREVQPRSETVGDLQTFFNRT